MPTERNPDRQKKYHQKTGPERRRGFFKQSEKIIDVYEGGMGHIPESMREPDQKSGHPGPIKTASPSAEVEALG